MIAVEGLEKTYGKNLRALDGTTFEVREGEIFGRTLRGDAVTVELAETNGPRPATS